MSDLKIKHITVYSDPKAHGYEVLKRSLHHHRWEHVGVLTTWRGFGTKIIESYKYIKEYCMDYDLVVFSDAYDTLVTTSPQHVANQWTAMQQTHRTTFGMILSAEKAAWPHPQVEFYYDKVEGTPFQYVNSGTWMANPRFFVNTMEKFGLPTYETDDQAFMTKLFLRKGEQYGILLDNYAEIFLCTAHSNETSFAPVENGRIRSLDTKLIPSIVHFNGRSHNEPQVKFLTDYYENLN